MSSLTKIDNIELELDDNTILSNLFGINDSNLSIIEKINNVKIQYRGNKIKIFGSRKSIFETKKTILDLFNEAKNGAEIDEDKLPVEYGGSDYTPLGMSNEEIAVSKFVKNRFNDQNLFKI